MKRGEYGPHTRGQWKHNELVWTVLAVLDVSKRSGVPPLTLRALYRMTGGNYRAISNKLPTWVDLGWIKKYTPRRAQYFVKPVYTYSITPKGKTRMLKMEIPYQRGNFKFKPGVNREAMIKRIPYFNNGRIT